ncbi:MAG: hypothetical protein HXY43_02720 [Fischerella sp.]|jgi:hypothetical protein|uniref:hypothetical protein n=1 Tax=Fischerella sp. TaxID=1191 RepID=UPI00184FF9BA|nr:hypothetical protein [Fischerella sp.]NWF58247.1 hypothetical protein [Fischerella sp.]
MARITISDISLEQNYLADLSETESAFVQGGLNFNTFLLGLAGLAFLLSYKKINAIQTLALFSIKAVTSV